MPLPRLPAIVRALPSRSDSCSKPNWPPGAEEVRPLRRAGRLRCDRPGSTHPPAGPDWQFRLLELAPLPCHGPPSSFYAGVQRAVDWTVATAATQCFG